jgi:hypothetical protein
MKTVNEMYNKSFFGHRYKLSWRAPHVIDAIEKVFKMDNILIKSYIDVGCAIGDLVDEAVGRGYEAHGIEGSEFALPFAECHPNRIHIGDLRRPVHKFMTVRRYSVLSCFEVAEHIEPKFADMLVKNLTTLSYNIIMSAAPPGQGGHHHYNCAPYKYWDRKFIACGYTKEVGLEEEFRKHLEPWKKKDGIRAFYENCLIYRRRWNDGG